jgi:hypothetical protein
MSTLLHCQGRICGPIPSTPTRLRACFWPCMYLSHMMALILLLQTGWTVQAVLLQCGRAPQWPSLQLSPTK